ncbi:MAG: hypothetical protein CEO22_400 [Candidatus Berkelbacteria bacterium Gr01-1014_85]|uniref:Uncharacterized protein n=1 Tax=Candidatus Berkelbacteria bacterium Gr01-1014_85 TaxID=2017150 RepID=A0A554JBA8_9BACT|nr:MAG: hypothetical protein CEO22_400 [Candidatus Berkelbacteria bacterium Gr01-1014_85]
MSSDIISEDKLVNHFRKLNETLATKYKNRKPFTYDDALIKAAKEVYEAEQESLKRGVPDVNFRAEE